MLGKNTTQNCQPVDFALPTPDLRSHSQKLHAAGELTTARKTLALSGHLSFYLSGKGRPSQYCECSPFPPLHFNRRPFTFTAGERKAIEMQQSLLDKLSVATYKKAMAKTKSKSGLAAELGKREPFSSPRQEAFINLMRTYDQLATQFAQLFKHYGVSDSQYNVLRILRGEGKPMQIYQIAERLIYAQADISRLIERLHATKMIHRERCGEDRRVVWISLTDKARKQLEKLDLPLQELHESQFSELSDRELRILNDLLFRARKADGLTQ